MSEVCAPMAGKIIKILVSPGDNVAEDEEVLIMEAMKMEMPVVCTCDGAIKDIKVKEGEAVEAEQVLILVD